MAKIFKFFTENYMLKPRLSAAAASFSVRYEIVANMRVFPSKFHQIIVYRTVGTKITNIKKDNPWSDVGEISAVTNDRYYMKFGRYFVLV